MNSSLESVIESVPEPSNVSTSNVSTSNVPPSPLVASGNVSPSRERLHDGRSRGGRLLGRPGLRQFIKYCLVGASSFAIDTAISFALFFGLHLSLNIANTISFLGGVTNGFYWNSRWTFGHIEKGNTRTRYTKFLTVNIIGLGLNLLCSNVILILLNGSTHQSVTSKSEYLIAKIGACAVVVFWNFFANKHWTFKA